MIRLNALQRAISGGASLAILMSCGETTTDDERGLMSTGGADTESGGQTSTGNASTGGAATGGAGAGPAIIPDEPALPDAGSCQGESLYHDGFGGAGGFFLSGPCCPGVQCYGSETGQCLEASDRVALEAEGIVFGVGSGTCDCGSTRGPYLGDGTQSSTEGQCCYILYIRSCTGRPLLGLHGAIVAPLVQRADWGARSWS